MPILYPLSALWTRPDKKVFGNFRGRILGRNLDKASRLFLLVIHSHLYSFALRFLFLQTHATSYSFYSTLLYTVKEKGGKPDRKPYPLPYSVRNPYRNLKFENSQDYAQKPQQNCTFMNSASCVWSVLALRTLFCTMYKHYFPCGRFCLGAQQRK